MGREEIIIIIIMKECVVINHFAKCNVIQSKTKIPSAIDRVLNRSVLKRDETF